MGVLQDRDLEWLMQHGTTRSLQPGTVLIREQQAVDSLYFLLDGELLVSVAGEAIATLLAGEIVGEISFVDSRPPSATVTAGKTSCVLEISRTDVKAKIAADEGFASRFYRSIAVFLADRLRVTTGRFGYGSAAQDAEQFDEMDPDVLDAVSLAAARFDQMLKRLRVH
jgi:CRP-like cAMP-binding protein